MHKINFKYVFVVFVYVFGVFLLLLCMRFMSDLYLSVKSFDVADDIKSTCVVFGFLGAIVLSGLAHLLYDLFTFVLSLFDKSNKSV